MCAWSNCECKKHFSILKLHSHTQTLNVLEPWLYIVLFRQMALNKERKKDVSCVAFDIVVKSLWAYARFVLFIKCRHFAENEFVSFGFYRIIFKQLQRIFERRLSRVINVIAIKCCFVAGWLADSKVFLCVCAFNLANKLRQMDKMV